MGLYIGKHELTQEQCDAIVPVLNAHMEGKVSSKKFEQACIDACERAGCPIPKHDEVAE